VTRPSRPLPSLGDRLVPKGGLLRAILTLGSTEGQSGAGAAPLTDFSWNEKMPSVMVTSSYRHDVAWLPSTDIIAADGSLRAFDVRGLEYNTTLYENPLLKNTAARRCGHCFVDDETPTAVARVRRASHRCS